MASPDPDLPKLGMMSSQTRVSDAGSEVKKLSSYSFGGCVCVAGEEDRGD